MRLLRRFHLDQAVVEQRRPAHVGELVAARELIRVLAVARELFPPYRERDIHAAARAIAHARAQSQAAPLVEDPHVAAVRYAARGGVVRMDIEPGLALDGAQTRHVDE